MPDADPYRSFLPCPGCTRTVGIPAAARGQTVVCPHCKASFRVRGGQAGELPAEVVPNVAWVPRSLIVPIYGLMLVGVTGCFVSGFLSARFARVPGADYDYAYARVIELRSNLNANSVGKPTDDEWEHLASAAVAGPAAAIHAAPFLEGARNEELATAWQPAIVPTTLISLGFSIVTVFGGLSMLSGRLYPLAFLGCLAAIFNVNYLCCVPGAIVGLWGILMLVRDEVRPHFGRASTAMVGKD